MTKTATNAQRAAAARASLAIFTLHTEGEHLHAMNPIDLESAVIDLIADLLHYARRAGFEPDRVLRLAREHFEAETLEEGDRL